RELSDDLRERLDVAVLDDDARVVHGDAGLLQVLVGALPQLRDLRLLFLEPEVREDLRELVDRDGVAVLVVALDHALLVRAVVRHGPAPRTRDVVTALPREEYRSEPSSRQAERPVGRGAAPTSGIVRWTELPFRVER